MKKQIYNLLIIVFDLFIVLTSIGCTWLLMTSNVYPRRYYFIFSVTYIISFLMFSSIFNLYNRIWKYATTNELLTLFITTVITVTTANIEAYIVFYFFDHVVPPFNLAMVAIPFMYIMLILGFTRFIYRIGSISHQDKKDFERVLIFGAGRGGRLLARQMIEVPSLKMKPIIFLDDDKNKYKKVINGIKVIGDRGILLDAINKYNIEKVVIAIPSLTRNKLQELYNICEKTGIKVQIMPNIDDVLSGKKEVSSLKNIDLEDLLGRESIDLNNEAIRKELNNKNILITGAGGSIGSEIVRQVSKFGPKNVILVGHGENSIYNINLEMKNKFKDSATNFIPVIADVQDKLRIEKIMNIYKPDIVYHAAAHKHVPLMEANPREAVKNNILGTKNVAEASINNGVTTFVLVSTDKAVNPPNIMGATKRWAEMIVQNLDKLSDTKFVAVRFGNVLGSRGSVIPLFKKQIEMGGPITVTHPEITRYFMTIPEASKLVIQAGNAALGGEVFVLDMGEPVKIVTLAENLIKLSGYSVEEIGIEFSGLRPGEKMYEELLNDNEVSDKKVHEKIYVGKAAPKDYKELLRDIDKFESLTDEELKKLIIQEANRKFTD